MIKYQNYKKYRLPITLNPLEYGKLIYHYADINLYIIYINSTNIALINAHDLFNEVKFFSKGDLIYEYKDHKIGNDYFVRSIGNMKFEFKDNVLI
jgi:hypothetical protein